LSARNAAIPAWTPESTDAKDGNLRMLGNPQNTPDAHLTDCGRVNDGFRANGKHGRRAPCFPIARNCGGGPA